MSEPRKVVQPLLQNPAVRIISYCGLASAYSTIPFLVWRRNTANTLVLVGYMFGPAAAALTMEKLAYGRIDWKRLGVSVEWPKISKSLAVATFTPICTAFLATVLSRLMFPSEVTLTSNVIEAIEYNLKAMGVDSERIEKAKTQLAQSPWLLPVTLINGIFAGATVNAVAAFGEELGWRGWLLRELKDSGLSFWPRVLVSGFAWGVWHWPIIANGYNYPQHWKTGIALFPAVLMAASTVATIVTERPDGSSSALNASIFHGEFNAFGRLNMLFTKGGDDLTNSICGYNGLAAWAITAFIVNMFR